MTERQAQITQILQKAIRRFNQSERFLIENRLCERCICARFAMYLERGIARSIFKGYKTDVEYDKGMGGNDYGKKKICGSDAYLDLIVHKRGFNNETGYDNLFAIEMKWQGGDFDQDKERLEVLVDNKNGFCYKAGFAVRIISDETHSVYELKIEDSYYNPQGF